MHGGDDDKLDPALRAFFAGVRRAICQRCGRTLAAHLLASFYAVEVGHLFEDICTN